MAFRLSPNAKEFVPANTPAFVFQSSSPGDVGAANAGPKQDETRNSILSNNQEQTNKQLNIAAPEFKPLANLQLSTSVFHRTDKPLKDYDWENSGPELLDQTRQPMAASPEVESHPSMYQSRRGIGLFQPELDEPDVEQKKHGVETQKKYRAVIKEDGKTEFEIRVRVKDGRKEVFSHEEPLAQSNMRRQGNERNFVAGSHEQHMTGRGSKQSWQRKEGNQISLGSKNGRTEARGWNIQNSCSSYSNSEQNKSRKENDYELYHGDLEGQRDSDNARKQKATNEGRNTQPYGEKSTFGNKYKPKKPPTTITENYEYKNVTNEFRDRAKRILFSGSVTNEATAVKGSYVSSWGISRGWYDPF